MSLKLFLTVVQFIDVTRTPMMNFRPCRFNKLRQLRRRLSGTSPPPEVTTTKGVSKSWSVTIRAPQLVICSLLGGSVAVAVGAYVWRYRWVENRLQELAREDSGSSNDVLSYHSSNEEFDTSVLDVSRRLPADMEHLKSHLNEPVHGMTYVESSSSKLSSDFVTRALAPRPCVVYITLNKCHADNPILLLKHLSRQLGAYFEFTYLSIREFCFFSQIDEGKSEYYLGRVLELLLGALQRLKDRDKSNFYPPVMVILGLENFGCDEWVNGQITEKFEMSEQTSGQRNKLSVRIVKQLFVFLSELSTKGLMHVVIPQQYGSTFLSRLSRHHHNENAAINPLEKDFAPSVLNSRSYKIFVMRPMDSTEALSYLYMNIFTTNSIIPGDMLNRIKINKSSSEVRSNVSRMVDELKAANPSTLSILRGISELLGSNHQLLASYINLVHSMGRARAAELYDIASSSSGSERQTITERGKSSYHISDVITPLLLKAAFRKLLSEQYHILSDTVMSSLYLTSNRTNIPEYRHPSKATEISPTNDSAIHKWNNDGGQSENRVLDQPSTSSSPSMSPSNTTYAVSSPAELPSEDPSTGSSQADGNTSSAPVAMSPEDEYDKLLSTWYQYKMNGGVDGGDVKNNISSSILDRMQLNLPRDQQPTGVDKNKLSNELTKSKKQAWLGTSLQPGRVLSPPVEALPSKPSGSRGDPLINIDASRHFLSSLDEKRNRLQLLEHRKNSIKSIAEALVTLTGMAMDRNFPKNLGRRHIKSHQTLLNFVGYHGPARVHVLQLLLQKGIISIRPRSNHIGTDRACLDAAVMFSEEDSLREYVVEFSSPILKRLVENLVIDGGFRVDQMGMPSGNVILPSDILHGSGSNGSLHGDRDENPYKMAMQSKNKRTRSPFLKRKVLQPPLPSSAIRVVGYGNSNGFTDETDVFESNNILERRKYVHKKPGTDSSPRENSDNQHSLFDNLIWLTSFFQEYDMMQGFPLAACDSKLASIMSPDNEAQVEMLSFLEERERALVRACAAHSGACLSSVSPVASVVDGSSRLSDISHERQLGKSMSVNIPSFHLEQIANIYGAVSVGDIQEILGSQGHLHDQSRIELALDMLYLEGQAIVPKELISSLDRLQLEDMMRTK